MKTPAPKKSSGVLGPAVMAVVEGAGRKPSTSKSSMTPEKQSAFMDLKRALDAGNPRLFYAALDSVMAQCGYDGGGPAPADSGLFDDKE